MKTFKQILLEGKGKRIKPPFEYHKKYDYYIVKSENDFFKWYNKLNLDDIIDSDIVLGDTGEVLIEKGQSRRKLLKKKGTKEYNEWGAKSFETIKQKAREKIEAPYLVNSSSFFEEDFELFYNIEFKQILEITGGDKEELNDADYDVERNVPYKIERKDKRNFVDADKHNIEEYTKFGKKEDLIPVNFEAKYMIRKNFAKIIIYFN